MSSIFSQIIAGNIPSYKIAEDQHNYAFLDINPNALGHTLVVPKIEVDKFFDLTTVDYLNLMKFTSKVAKALEKTIPCNRIGMTVVGLEVPHAHVHLIPINRVGDINFTDKKLSLTKNEFEEIADKIRANFID